MRFLSSRKDYKEAIYLRARRFISFSEVDRQDDMENAADIGIKIEER